MNKYKTILFQRTRLYILHQNGSCFHISKRSYASKENKHRNLFELYKNNPNWLGVYKRHPVLNDKIDQSAMQKKVLLEKKKETKLHLPSHIDPVNEKWVPKSIRVGAIGIKLGVSVLWTKNGFCHMVTLVQVQIIIQPVYGFIK